MFYPVYTVIVLVGISLVIAILRFLAKKKLNESNAILWVCIGVVIVLAGLFPRVVEKLSHIFSITYPPAFVFTIAILILLIIVLKNTIIISELTAKVEELAVEVSILRHEFFEQQKEIEHLYELICIDDEIVGDEGAILDVAQNYTITD